MIVVHIYRCMNYIVAGSISGELKLPGVLHEKLYTTVSLSVSFSSLFPPFASDQHGNAYT